MCVVKFFFNFKQKSWESGGETRMDLWLFGVMKMFRNCGDGCIMPNILKALNRIISMSELYGSL